MISQNKRSLNHWLPKSGLVQEFIFSYGLVHGRPQTFFKGRAKFSRGGPKTYYSPKKHLKTYYFPLKRSKTYYFGRPGGSRAPFCPPLRTPMVLLFPFIFCADFLNKKCRKKFAYPQNAILCEFVGVA